MKVVILGSGVIGVTTAWYLAEAGHEVHVCDRQLEPGPDRVRHKLARGLGFRLPIYPVKGYSLTADLLDEVHAPRSTIMDETYKIGITRFEKRLRIGGTAELAGFDTSLRLARRAPLEHSATDLFPGVGDMQTARFWAGLRPMTPDGTPIIGPSPLENLYLNTGHGTLGWTMACGSAKLLCDQISGRKPDIASDDLAFARY